MTILRCTAGPDAGWTLELGPGSHWLGRAAGGIELDDPAVEPYHAWLHVDADGAASVLHVTGRAPLVVEGAPTHGWAALPARTAIEVGGSRLELGRQRDDPARPTGWVFAPRHDGHHELTRFARDVDRAAAQAAERHLTNTEPQGPGIGPVEIGVAEAMLPVDLRARGGVPIALAELTHAAQAVVDRTCRRVLPVRFEPSAEAPTLIAAPHPEPIIEALLSQLHADPRSSVIVAPVDDADMFVDSGRPVIAWTDDTSVIDEPGPPWCRRLLRVGTTWRGTWHPDLVDRPGDVIEVHARGRSPRRSGRLVGASADAGRAVVAQKVPGTDAELGGGIIGVPQTTRLQ